MVYLSSMENSPSQVLFMFLCSHFLGNLTLSSDSTLQISSTSSFVVNGCARLSGTLVIEYQGGSRKVHPVLSLTPVHHFLLPSPCPVLMWSPHAMDPPFIPRSLNT